MKLNNKGFTLIELLGVIVILITILLIAIPSISATMSRNKEKELVAKQELIIAETKLYVEGHQKDAANFLNGSCSITTQTLQEQSIVSKDNLLDSDGNLIEGCIYYNVDQRTYHFENPCTKSACPGGI